MEQFIIILFVAAFGACVGSFINVVAYRLPEGRSLIWPPSNCPSCKTQLLWWENMPIFGWIYLGGKCRTCQKPISAQYPIVEAICALLFVATYCCYYTEPLNVQFDQPFHKGFADTWPVFVIHLILISALLAATVIDARLYIIPIEIPWLVTVIALIALPLYAMWQPVMATQNNAVTPTTNMYGVHAAMGGFVGLALAVIFLWVGLLPRSFDDEEARQLDEQASAAQRDEGETAEASESADSQAEATEEGESPAEEETDGNPVEAFLTYSHPRREVLKELLFVLLPTAGVIGALLYLPPLVPDGHYPEWARVLAGVTCGYLVGGGIVWYTRIFGTLGFGREAMGLGDVHLLAGIGAVLGPIPVVVIFFVAPFLGLAYVAISIGLSKVAKGKVRIIPYGPYLAMAAVLVMLIRRPLLAIFGNL